MKMLWKLGTFNITFIYYTTSSFDQKTERSTYSQQNLDNMLILHNISLFNLRWLYQCSQRSKTTTCWFSVPTVMVKTCSIFLKAILCLKYELFENVNFQNTLFSKINWVLDNCHFTKFFNNFFCILLSLQVRAC